MTLEPNQVDLGVEAEVMGGLTREGKKEVGTERGNQGLIGSLRPLTKKLVITDHQQRANSQVPHKITKEAASQKIPKADSN